MLYQTQAPDAAKLAKILLAAEGELSEWAADASYHRDDAAAAGDHVGATWFGSRAQVAGGCAEELRELRRDLDALVEVQAAADRYVRAVEQLCRRRDAEVALQPLVVGMRVVRRAPIGAQALANEHP